ncbi:pentatricopeptide repeat-containing protein At3g25210, mitochondrial [Neltuma alba]|uniref:pentatricopeptide repeat-containing protein At3g25210, mitochondrial n=2 Tax=Neltuma alba TaxID=207710 RepID=UPI0010A51422|nr:pentatricopeptide repeat-containing protein At3g25210, mitochondrial-like [Prosopis alba]XP_028807364.1 pentatricopeptide repeat-containing protein At3g25210, mitochondrial-like [Prosopis alba]XP_028807365.1 pentatricopeptide repeat-containing protein At3g25210, mitochondrial-like [Prosopis alba]XP_028807366.1 pentatricopeptide repeat-containing protein At3g25210, mitochondrial-like [Prosopis alba]XP_028807367.1 pentatricopeptide repeat-containing protein At3g25210, mitochondrial-like [Proso
MPAPSKCFFLSISRSIYILSFSSSLRPLHTQPSCSLALSFLYARSMSSSPHQDQNLQPQFTNPSSRTRTPLEKQFETWVQKLKPGFTPFDVDEALRAQSDPDLALDIFRWTAQQRGYKHNNVTYLTMIKQLISGRRYRHTETLVEEVIAGACDASVPLYNSIIRFCCGRKFLFNRAFDVYKKMLKSEDCKPTLETYSLLFNSLLRRFNKLNVCYVYLHAVRSMTKQMKASGVIPDTFVLNMIIKAYAKCLEVDEAIRVFHEMGLYGCEPNAYTYGYIAKGLCEKGRVNQGLGFFKEMRGKCLVPSTSTYVIIICSLALERRFEDAIEIVFDMLGNSRSPDQLTYKTVLEGLCREGRGNEAFELLDEWRNRDISMNDKTYKILLNGLHFLSRE